MAILACNKTQTKEKLKIEINADTLRQIQAYCEWADINDLGFFFEEASHFVFSKDREWKKKLKSEKVKV